MATVIARVDKFTGERESVDSMLRRFKKAVVRDEIMLDLKKHEYYRAPSLKRREKSAAARKRDLKFNK